MAPRGAWIRHWCVPGRSFGLLCGFFAPRALLALVGARGWQQPRAVARDEARTRALRRRRAARIDKWQREAACGGVPDRPNVYGRLVVAVDECAAPATCPSAVYAGRPGHGRRYRIPCNMR